MIPHNKPTIGIEEYDAVSKVFDSKFLVKGKEVKKFENEFCKYMNLPEGHAVAVSSGTAALYLSLNELGVTGKEVGIPVYTCSAVRNAVLMAGGLPVYMDSEFDSANIDLAFTKKNNIKNLIVPHMYGIPVDIPFSKGIKIIEDCAQSLGAAVNNIKVGLRGDLGIFSFYATKLITTGGQGGMVVSKKKSYIDGIRDYIDFDMRKDKKKRFNFNMTEMQAAVGRVQLKKLPGFLKKRKNIFELYEKTGLKLLNAKNTNIKPVRYRAVILTKKSKKLLEYLNSNGISAINPLNKWELLNNNKIHRNAINFTKKSISLPIFPSLTESQVSYISEKLQAF